MSRRRRLLFLLVAAAVLVAGGAVGLRVLGGTDAPVLGPLARPDQALPGPVLLVPGYGGGRGALLALERRIEATGREAEVLTLVGDGTGDLYHQVAVLDEAADAALARGAPSVDVVGYSAGGVVAGLWVAHEDGAAKARRVITLGSPLGGTTVAAVGAAFAPEACPAACRQLTPGSPVVAELARVRVGEELPWLSVWTRDDELVTPPETARLPGAVNVEVQSVCPGARVGHGALPTDPMVTGLVLRAISAAPLTGAGAAECGELRAAGR